MIVIEMKIKMIVLGVNKMELKADKKQHRHRRFILRRIHLAYNISPAGLLLRQTRYNNKQRIYHRRCIMHAK